MSSAKTFSVVSLLAVALSGCGTQHTAGRMTPLLAAEIADDLCDRLEAAPMTAVRRVFFLDTAKSVKKYVDLVRDADRWGYGEEFYARRAAGYAVWSVLTEDSSLARSGIFVDASEAVDACARLGLLSCDQVGWEYAYAPPPVD